MFDEESHMIGSKCPSCGANLNIDSKNKIIVCPYCGQKFNNKKEKDNKNYARYDGL